MLLADPGNQTTVSDSQSRFNRDHTPTDPHAARVQLAIFLWSVAGVLIGLLLLAESGIVERALDATGLSSDEQPVETNTSPLASASPTQSTFVSDEEKLRRQLVAAGIPCASLEEFNPPGLTDYRGFNCRDATGSPYSDGTVSFDLYTGATVTSDIAERHDGPVLWTSTWVVEFPNTDEGLRWLDDLDQYLG